MSATVQAEQAARESYGRLLSRLARVTRDVALAEDALSEAFADALTQWPVSGVPDAPDAWLLTAARRRVFDEARRASVRSREEATLVAGFDTVAQQPQAIPDERLRLLFVCAHPSIDPSLQSALMLQTVLGLSAEAISSALLVAPKTLGQRLWRAKCKLRDTGVPFEVPEPGELTARLGAVLEAIYVAFGSGWEDVPRGGEATGLVHEALFLCRLVVSLLPDEPEPRGLLALMLFAEARREARRSASGVFVPLEHQDTSRWNRAHIAEATEQLERAFSRHRPGPWQLEAAIQAAHVDGGLNGTRDLRAVVDLYDGLVHFAPSLGAFVGRAAAILEARGPADALAALDDVDVSARASYQPFHVVRSLALERAGRVDEAAASLNLAIGLTQDAAVRDFLLARLATLAPRTRAS